MLSQYGEDDVEKVDRCPGQSCSQFSKRIDRVKGKTWKDRALEAVAGCDRCEGNPPEEDQPDDEEISEIVDEIEEIVAEQNAGAATDWDAYGFYVFALVKEWRRTEKICELRHSARVQAFFKGSPDKK